MYVKDAILWCVRQCGTMVDVSQVMITHTITCQIHVSRHTTPLSNELSCNCNCTDILDLLTMKLELLSPLLSDSPFLSSKVFLFFRFSNLTVEWTKWNHACWGPWKLSILNSFLVFPRPVNYMHLEIYIVNLWVFQFYKVIRKLTLDHTLTYLSSHSQNSCLLTSSLSLGVPWSSVSMWRDSLPRPYTMGVHNHLSPTQTVERIYDITYHIF
jgi:hypothetical protein